jgi:uncharacterized membrane protein
MFFNLQDKKSEKEISRLLDQDGEVASVEELTNLLHKPKGEIEEKISNHFYLAPLNIFRGQLLFAIVVFFIVMAISVVRFGGEPNILLILGVMGAVIALPYLIFFFALKWSFSLSKLQLIAFMSFIYSLLISLLFAGYASIDGLWGLLAIPALLILFYLLELRKLAKLFDYLNGKSNA